MARFLSRDLWRREWAEAPTIAAFGVHVLRLFTIAGRGLIEHNQGLRAAALTYYTVLSLVPTLAFAFALAKGFGAYDRLQSQVIEPFVESTFGGEQVALDEDGEAEALVVEPSEIPADAVSPGTSDLRDAIDQVLDFVTQTDVSSLGGIGLAVLLFTVVKLMGHVEAALNATFGIRRLRSVPRRIADYTAMATISPILALTATAVGATAQSQEAMDYLRTKLDLGWVLDVTLKLLPLGAFWIGFTLLFLVMPNTRVKLRSAAIGGFVAALLWLVSQRVYVGAQVGVASYNSLYAGFAAIPLFLVWTWMSWMVVLAGAEFAHADQNHSAYGALRLAGSSTPAEVERTGLRILVRMAGRFRAGRSPWTTGDFIDELSVPSGRVTQAFDHLVDAGIVLAADVADDESAWVFARSPASIRVEDARRALRGDLSRLVDPSQLDTLLERELEALEHAESDLTENRTLEDLATRLEEQAE